MKTFPAVISIQAHGRIMDIANPKTDDIIWSEVASSLSKIARFNGSYSGISYSVAQHCVMGADALFKETNSGLLAGYFLLHDAHEAFFGDFPRPSRRLVKAHLHELSPQISKLYDIAIIRSKATLDHVIYSKAGLMPLLDFSHKDTIADMDDRMLHVEVQSLFGTRATDFLPEHRLAAVRLDSPLKAWPHMKAEEAWLERLSRYLNINSRGL